MHYAEFRKRYHWNAKTDKLGEGGFGKVYRATDTLRNRLVVLKIADVPVEHKFSLQREVELNRDLSTHPNIAQFRNCYRFENEYGEEKDYATMDYFSEGSLTTILKKYTLSQVDKHDIIVGILRGLAHLENERVIHRDFKPGNVLMARSDKGRWVPKIADFGLSRFTSNEITFSNSSVGISYDYAAPEQFQIGSISQQADLWAAGVIFYQLLTGDLPFAVPQDLTGESRRLEIIRRIERAQIPARLNEVEEPYQRIIRRFLVNNLSMRVKSAYELLDLVNNGMPPVAIAPIVQTEPVTAILPKPQENRIRLTESDIPITREYKQPIALNRIYKLEGKQKKYFILALITVGIFLVAYYDWEDQTFDKSAFSITSSIPAINLPEPLNPSQLVNDFVGILSAEERRQLEDKLLIYNKYDVAQIIIIVVKTTHPYPIKDFAVSIGRKWKVGAENKNNGIVITWSVEDRQLFIATGNGLAEILPDSTVKNIIDQKMIPDFKRSLYYQGLNEGIDALVDSIN